MPISPENKRLYPEDWKDIRAQIKERAGNRCENCGAENHAWGYRSGPYREFKPLDEIGQIHFEADGGILIEIVCTVAHLDHDPTNNDFKNLKFLCQSCHNKHDAGHRAETRRKKRGKDQLNLL